MKLILSKKRLWKFLQTWKLWIRKRLGRKLTQKTTADLNKASLLFWHWQSLWALKWSCRGRMISPRKISVLIHTKKQLLLISVLEGLFLSIWEQTEWFSSLLSRRKTAIFCQKDPLAHKPCLFTYPLKSPLIYSVQKGIYSAFQIPYPVWVVKPLE